MQDNWRLANYLVHLQEERGWWRQSERLGHLEIHDELEPRRLLDGHIGGLRALENLVHVLGDALVDVRPHRPIAHEPPGARHVSPLVYRRNPVLGSCLDDHQLLAKEAYGRRNEYGVDPRLAQGCERRIV